MQSEIAQAVASSLKVTLLGKGANAHQPGSTRSVEAHNAYLQGHYYFERSDVEGWRRALGFYDDAIRLDPDAMAYAERGGPGAWPPTRPERM